MDLGIGEEILWVGGDEPPGKDIAEAFEEVLVAARRVASCVKCISNVCPEYILLISS